MTKYLLVILFLGYLLRAIFININPPSLYGDELTITLDSYSLLKTGQDQLGNFLPLTFKMGAGRPAGYVYGSIPFIGIFGPSALGVRMLSILSGVGIIILTYLITRKILNEKLALVAAFIAAVSPWEISLSRGGFEAHLGLFLALLGGYLFLKAKEKPFYYFFSAISLGLTFHTYPTYKLIILLFLPLLIWFQGGFKNLNKKAFLIGIIILGMLGILALSQTFIGGSETRFSDINIFSKKELSQQLEQKINLERNIITLPGLISKFFHNKQIEYTKIFIENYLQNFSLDFLILHGDRNPRHNMATTGEIYFVDLILILIGIVTFWTAKKREVLFLLLWLFLAPIPTAIIDLPHALRSAFMLPPLIILSSLGLVAITERKKKIALFLVGVLFIIQFIFFIQKLYFLAPREYASFWAYEGKRATEIALENKNMYDYIFLSDRIDSIEYAYPVYAKVSAQNVIVQNQNKVKLEEYYFKKFDNVYIGSIPPSLLDNFLKELKGNVLYIGLDNSNNIYLIKK